MNLMRLAIRGGYSLREISVEPDLVRFLADARYYVLLAAASEPMKVH